jgi:hypothetical protein
MDMQTLVASGALVGRDFLSEMRDNDDSIYRVLFRGPIREASINENGELVIACAWMAWTCVQNVHPKLKPHFPPWNETANRDVVVTSDLRRTVNSPHARVHLNEEEFGNSIITRSINPLGDNLCVCLVKEWKYPNDRIHEEPRRFEITGLVAPMYLNR